MKQNTGRNNMAFLVVLLLFFTFVFQYQELRADLPVTSLCEADLPSAILKSSNNVYGTFRDIAANENLGICGAGTQVFNVLLGEKSNSYKSCMFSTAAVFSAVVSPFLLCMTRKDLSEIRQVCLLRVIQYIHHMDGEKGLFVLQ